MNAESRVVIAMRYRRRMNRAKAYGFFYNFT